MDVERSEDTLVFLALNPKVTKIDKVLDGLREFFEKKQLNDRTDRFNIITFIKNRPVYFEDFTYDGNYLITAIKDFIPQLVKQNVAGGIFVAVTFIIDVFQKVSGKAFRLLILTDKETPRMKNIEVVQGLVDQVVDLPFFIDIVRINVKNDPREDLRLMRFAKTTRGDIYYAKNEKDTENVLSKLAEKKKISSKGFGDSGEEIYIDPENEMFFESLAEDPVMIFDQTEEMSCQICGKGNDLHKCGKCGVTVHRECLAMWAKFSNAGLPNVFRCQNCFNLLRLSFDFVEMVQSGKKPEEVINDTNKFSSQEDILKEIDNSRDDLEMVFKEMGNIFDMEEGEEEEDILDTFNLKDDMAEIQIIFCDNCGKMCTNENNFCPGCGTKLK